MITAKLCKQMYQQTTGERLKCVEGDSAIIVNHLTPQCFETATQGLRETKPALIVDLIYTQKLGNRYDPPVVMKALIKQLRKDLRGLGYGVQVKNDPWGRPALTVKW